MDNTKHVLLRAAVITVIAELAALVVFVVIRWLSGEAIELWAWLEPLSIRLIVGMPIATTLLTRHEKLRVANERLIALNEAQRQAHQKLQEAYDTIAFAARHDRMTGVLNREGFMEDLARWHAASEQSVLLIVDVDYFKSINDRFGHVQGDLALVAISDAICRAVRPTDLVGRIGGEEFGVLLRSVSTVKAAEISEQIRLEVVKSSWGPSDKELVPLSVSIGGATVRDFPDNVTAMIIQADKCLYDAKRSGRNRIALNAGLSDMARSMVDFSQRQDARAQR